MTTAGDTARAQATVIGCGIGGITTALALARKGISVHVFERAKEIGEAGAGLQVGPNAGRILADLGVLDYLTVRAVLPGRAVMRDIITGEEIVALDFGEFQERYGAPYRVMHRGDLLTGLLKAAADTGLVTVTPGKDLVDVVQDEREVTAVFADGSTVSAEILIGADGIRSRVRRLLGDQSPPLASKYVIYRGTFARTDEFEDAVTLQTGDRHHVMHYPIRGGEMMNLVCSFRSERGPVGSAAWGTPDELDEYFADSNQVVRSAIARLDRSKKWVQFDRDPQPGWAQGRMLIVGDAAHATHQYFAQGACQAMEDAVVLADLLAGAGDLAAGLADFEAKRYPRTTAVQRGSRFWGELTHVGGPEAERRDAMLGRIGGNAVTYLDWLYGKQELPIPAVPDSREVYEVLDSERVLSQ